MKYDGRFILLFFLYTSAIAAANASVLRSYRWYRARYQCPHPQRRTTKGKNDENDSFLSGFFLRSSQEGAGYYLRDGPRETGDGEKKPTDYSVGLIYIDMNVA